MSRHVKSIMLFVAIVAAIGWSLQWYTATAQDDEVKALKRGASEVAVLDVGKVFKEHEGFNESLEKMKQEVKDYENELRLAREAIQKLINQAKPLEPGTQARNTIERQVAQDTAALQAETGLKRKEFVNREARLYSKTYTQISREVARFSRANKIGLVIRFKSEPIDQRDPKSILAGVNASIVFHDQVDITDEIVELVNANKNKKVELN